MGDVGRFFLGGSESNQTGHNTSSYSNFGNSQSTNDSVQASASGSNNLSQQSSSGYNQAYGPVSAAMMPALGYTTTAGNMMAALLGLPPSTFSYDQTPYEAPARAAPLRSRDAAVKLPRLDTIIKSLVSTMPTSSTPSPSTGTPPGSGISTPVTGRRTGGALAGDGGYDTYDMPTLTGRTTNPWLAAHENSEQSSFNVPTTGSDTYVNKYGTGADLYKGELYTPVDIESRLNLPDLSAREAGGPVQAGRPYLVGEKRPEIFVPEQSGTIVPRVPGVRDNPRRLGMGDLLADRGPKQHGAVMPPTNTGIVPPATTTTAPPVTPTGYTGSNPYNPSVGSPSDAVNTFANSAGMNFILDQGQKAVSGASASNGVFNSGATGKALEQYGVNLGKTYLDNYYNHLLQLGQLGLGAGTAMTGAGGVTSSSGSSVGNSSSVSGGLTNGQSTSVSGGSGGSSGTTSGSSDSKNGLLPVLGSMAPKPGN